MNKIKQKLICLFFGHKWKYYKSVWDYSEPHEHSGDYLPTKGTFYKCKCGAEKRKYRDGFIHLGTSPPRTYLTR